MSAPRGNRGSPEIGNAEQRRDAGCIVSFENERGDAFLTLHRTGPLVDAVREACALALAADPTFRVVSYSTPQTILSDLAGSRSTYQSHGHTTNTTTPEAAILGRASLRHMAHPRLVIGQADRR